ncbi:MAG: sigma 54-interacting transcriptional regulator, partial [Desulfomonile tiedjei]|nr:sigma 54-interacting transcriptional regulator [Desulfomonile tiedjei]
IMGETGVGKEVIAHEIFRQSHHGKEVFLQMDLLENQRDLPLFKNRLKEDPPGDSDPADAQMELFFGVEEPDSRGGTKETPGYFELADGGTLLVRGVDRLAPRVQMELLEAVTTESFRRRGGLMLRKAKVRLIATTRLDSSAVALETLPLLFALQKFAITIPPLRKRLREIPSLAKHYMDRYSRQLQRTVRVIPDESMKVLVSYPWPGNDFELANTMKRAVLVAQGTELKPRDVSLDLGRAEGHNRYNLMKFSLVRGLLSSPLFPVALQAGMLALFLMFVVGLFYGPPETRQNPSALLGWTLAWPLFIITAFVVARFWCAVCPIRTIAELCTKILALERPLPRFVRDRGDFIIAASVVFILWVEAVTSMRDTPYHLGLLLVSLVLSAVVVSVMYERNAWCGYLCGLGGIAGTFAKSSILELRMDRNVCSSQCTSNACYSGTTLEPGCLTGKAGPRLRSNRSCILCGSCVKNCPHGAVNVNLRLPGAEIWEPPPVSTGTAFLVLAMIGGLMGEMMAGHALFDEVKRTMGVPEKVFLTGVFLAAVLAVNLTGLGASTISGMVCRESTMENFRRFSIGFLPLALMGFLAFHSYYLVSLGGHLLELVGGISPVEMVLSPDFPVLPRVTELIQQSLIGFGMLWSAVCLFKIARQVAFRNAGRWTGCFPHLCVMCLSGLVLLKCITGAQ